ncbi:hypothetical protein [Cetobacterium sp.]|uniref:hypothetical protein n=1 Tax=Cetobacterium sp. TaxID=2071632 RepID=UPI003F399D27
MRNIEQLEIGGVFEVNGVKYEVVMQSRLKCCEGCSFTKDTCISIERPFCGAIRKDWNKVIFVKVK